VKTGLQQHGFDKVELQETLMQLAIYAGLPAANTAFAEAGRITRNWPATRMDDAILSAPRRMQLDAFVDSVLLFSTRTAPRSGCGSRRIRRLAGYAATQISEGAELAHGLKSMQRSLPACVQWTQKLL